jgi:hypothetical protein
VLVRFLPAGLAAVGFGRVWMVLENLIYRPLPARLARVSPEADLRQSGSPPRSKAGGAAMARLSARIERFYALEANLPPTIDAVHFGSVGRPTEFGPGYGYADEVRELAAAACERFASPRAGPDPWESRPPR